MAGTTTVSSSFIEMGFSRSIRAQKISVSFVADAADGSVPNTTLTLNGYLMKIVTNPGSTAPTDNWDIQINDEHGVGVTAATTDNRDTTTSEQVYPTITGATAPVWVVGTHTLVISGNSVNSATGVVDIYLKDSL
jgi:hypothetical protein